MNDEAKQTWFGLGGRGRVFIATAPGVLLQPATTSAIKMNIEATPSGWRAMPILISDTYDHIELVANWRPPYLPERESYFLRNDDPRCGFQRVEPFRPDH